MKCDFKKFTVDVLSVCHVFIIFNSIFISDTISFMGLPSMTTDVSFSDKIDNILFDALDI